MPTINYWKTLKNYKEDNICCGISAELYDLHVVARSGVELCQMCLPLLGVSSNTCYIKIMQYMVILIFSGKGGSMYGRDGENVNYFLGCS